MTTVYVGYYNHRPVGVPVEDVLRKACREQTSPFVFVDMHARQTPDLLDLCRIMVIHGSLSLEEPTTKASVSCSYLSLARPEINTRDGLVVIYLSSGESDHYPRRVTFNDRTRFLLPVRNAIKIGLTAKADDEATLGAAATKWRLLLADALDRNKLERWFESRGRGGISAAFDEALLEPVGQELISAIAILCQGFLAQHAIAYSELLSRPAEQKQFSIALERMGWAEFAKATSPLLVSEDALLRSNTVQQPDWWRAVVSGTRQEVKQQLVSEWKSSSLPTSLEILVDEIIPMDASINEMGQSTGKVQLNTVSAAYLELADHLEKHR